MRGGKLSSVQRFSRKDPKWKYLQKTKQSNLSVLEILINGCFDTDWKSYCVNRINGFSCSYWLESDDMVSPVSIEENNLTTQSSSISTSIESKSFCQSSAIDPGNISISILIKLLITIFVILAIILNLLTLFTMRKLAHIYLPICHYFTYICIFELLDCLILSLDWLISIFSVFQPLQILQLLSQSSCQMMPMLFSICRHLTSGLTIGIAIDLWRFIQCPVHFLGSYRSEWVKNVFIMFMVLVCTINCQFFWTFDLNHGENKVLNGRLISNYLECDFSNTLPLNTVFTRFIWPITDHVLSELLPFILGLFSVIVSSYLVHKKFKLKYPINLSKVLINAPLVLQLTKCLIGFLFINIIFNLLPRMIYFSIKLSLQKNISGFSTTKLMQNNFLEQSLLTNEFSNRRSNKNFSFLVSFGKYIKYQPLFNIIIRFIYFSITMKEFRNFSFREISFFNLKNIFRKRMIRTSVTTEKFFTNSSLDRELVNLDETDEIKRKSLLVEIYC